MKKIVLTTILLALLDLSCSVIYPLSLGSDYYIEYDHNSYFCIRNKLNTIIIDSHVTKYNYDTTFIIVEQKPFEVILENKQNDPNFTLPQIKKIFNKSKIRYYWIINKEEKKTFGPYNKNQFIQEKKNLGVSKNMQLKPVP